MTDEERGTLKVGEPHPAAHNALAWIMSMPAMDLAKWEESFNSCAIEGNRLAEVCAETMRRLRTGQAVSDRYLLGLAWSMADRISGGSEDGEEDGKAEVAE